MLIHYSIIWLKAIRPFTLPASVVPVFIGAALASQQQQWSPLLLLIILIGTILVQIGTNLIDEYVDHKPIQKNVDKLPPYKVIALGLLSRNTVRLASILAYLLATIIGISLVMIIGWPILIFSIPSILAAYFYTAGPKPLGNILLGWPLVFVFMGPVIVIGTYYALTLSITLSAIYTSVPIGISVTTILVINDIRDITQDRESGKSTPVTLFGVRFGVLSWVTLVITLFTTVLVIGTVGSQTLWVLLTILTIPLWIRVWRSLISSNNQTSYTNTLILSAKTHLYFGIIFAIGLILSHHLKFTS